MAVLGLPLTLTARGYEIPTELGATAFGLIAGVGGGIAQIIASSRLSEVEGELVPMRKLAIPIATSMLASAAAGYLVPTTVNN